MSWRIEDTTQSVKDRKLSDSMNSQLILYSCYSWVAYEINRRYYGGIHYAWCTPYFNPTSHFNPPNSVPPSSSPWEIFKSLHEEVRRGDKHSAKIEKLRDRMKDGARVRMREGRITEPDYDEIVTIVNDSPIWDFRPIIFAIPRESVMSQAGKVGVRDRAHMMSEEFIIKDLRREQFDVLEVD